MDELLEGLSVMEVDVRKSVVQEMIGDGVEVGGGGAGGADKGDVLVGPTVEWDPGLEPVPVAELPGGTLSRTTDTVDVDVDVAVAVVVDAPETVPVGTTTMVLTLPEDAPPFVGKP